MNLVNISNALKSIVDGSQGRIAAFHTGYHSDINANIDNAYNPDGSKAKRFPLLLWAMPAEGEISLKGGHGSDVMQVELYLYDLQEYDIQGNPTTPTLVEHWDRLKRVAVEVLAELQKIPGIKVAENRAKWFVDSNMHVDRLLCVGLTFSIYDTFGCADYQGTPLFNPSFTTSATELEYE